MTNNKAKSITEPDLPTVLWGDWVTRGGLGLDVCAKNALEGTLPVAYSDVPASQREDAAQRAHELFDRPLEVTLSRLGHLRDFLCAYGSKDAASRIDALRDRIATIGAWDRAVSYKTAYHLGALIYKLGHRWPEVLAVKESTEALRAAMPTDWPEVRDGGQTVVTLD